MTKIYLVEIKLFAKRIRKDKKNIPLDNAYGPHAGLLSMVLQRKRSQGRAGHMIKRNILCTIYFQFARFYAVF